MPRLVVVQRQVSQVDEPVYARLHELEPGSISVIYWNDYGLSRLHADPETGTVPNFSGASETDYPTTWLDSRVTTVRDVIAKAVSLSPKIVIVSDIANRDRLLLSAAVRAKGSQVAFRTDKNHLSETANSGLRLSAERHLARIAFNILAPVTPQTLDYYEWPRRRPRIPFPYTTSEKKFGMNGEQRLERRRAVRTRFGIADSAPVFLSAAKFVDRENPWGLVRSFERVAAQRPEAKLIALGDGPLLPEIRRYCEEKGLPGVLFPGFVPFRGLEDYFYAADVFLHFAEIEPWGISPQDALIAGLSVITSDRVGTGDAFLTGALARFCVPPHDEERAADRMLELISRSVAGDQFACARQAALAHGVEACARRWLAA